MANCMDETHRHRRQQGCLCREGELTRAGTKVAVGRKPKLGKDNALRACRDLDMISDGSILLHAGESQGQAPRWQFCKCQVRMEILKPNICAGEES